MTPEQRIKYEEATKKNTGRKMSVEAIEKLRQVHLNRQYEPHSEETKAKISAGGKKAWAKRKAEEQCKD